MADHDDDARGGPLSRLSPGARLALAGIGILVGIALVFLGLHSFETPHGDDPGGVDIPASMVAP